MSLISRLRRNHKAHSNESLTKPPDAPRKFFVHIPKTAGTSFRKSVVDHFGQQKILQDYGSKKAATSNEILACVYKTGDATAIEDAFSRSEAVMVSGHVSVAKYAGIIGLPNTTLFVREPVARVVSHFRHMLRDEGFEGDLLKFIRSPGNQNVQSKVLCQLDPALIGVLGITEQYQASIDIINKRWNWMLNHRKDNISDQMSDVKVSLSSEEEAEIIKLNATDLTLYTRATQVFSNSLACLKSDSASDHRGAISMAKVNHGISGWAFDMFSDQATEINVIVNQEVKATLKCMDFRPVLAGWKVPRRGYIGFHLRNISLKDGDSVEIRDRQHNLVLDSTTV